MYQTNNEIIFIFYLFIHYYPYLFFIVVKLINFRYQKKTRWKYVADLCPILYVERKFVVLEMLHRLQSQLSVFVLVSFHYQRKTEGKLKFIIALSSFNAFVRLVTSRISRRLLLFDYEMYRNLSSTRRFFYLFSIYSFHILYTRTRNPIIFLQFLFMVVMRFENAVNIILCSDAFLFDNSLAAFSIDKMQQNINFYSVWNWKKIVSTIIRIRLLKMKNLNRRLKKKKRWHEVNFYVFQISY